MRLLRSRVFWVCALFVAMPAIWYFWVAEWLAEKEWQAYVQEAKARGVRWTLAEFRPAPVPPDEDAARLSIFATGEGAAPPPQFPVIFKTMKRPKDGRPAPIDWQRMRKHLPDYRLVDDPAEPNDVLALDKVARPLQPLVEELCQSKAIAGNWGNETWTVAEDFNLPHASPVMRGLRLLQLRANLDLALNRPADARRAVEAQLRLARVCQKMPTLMMHLVTLSGTGFPRETVWHGLEIGAWDDDSLRAFAIEFLAWNAIADHVWALETERAYMRELAERWIGNPEKVIPMIQSSKPTPSKVDEWLLRMRASRRSWWRNNQVWIERSQDELLSMFDDDAQVWRPFERKYDPKKLNDRDREGKLGMAAETMSSAETFMRSTLWAHAQNQMAAVACALELCRRASGNYPEMLEALVPAYLPRLPVDAATGGAFHYRLQPDGTYLLYSVGFDREDQGGKVDPTQDRDLTDPDWPWFAPRVQPKPSKDSAQ